MTKKKNNNNDDTELNNTDGAVNLPSLNAHEIEFCQHRIEGKGVTESYILAFNPDTKERNKASIASSATNLHSKPKIRQWLQAMREAGCDKAGFTVEQHLSELEILKNKALAGENYGAAVRAEELRGKAAGFYVERKEVSFKNSPEQLVKDLQTVFGVDFAKQAAKKLGLSTPCIDVTPVTNKQQIPN